MEGHTSKNTRAAQIEFYGFKKKKGHKLGMAGTWVGLTGTGEEGSKHLHEILEELIKIYILKSKFTMLDNKQ